MADDMKLNGFCKHGIPFLDCSECCAKTKKGMDQEAIAKELICISTDAGMLSKRIYEIAGKINPLNPDNVVEANKINKALKLIDLLLGNKEYMQCIGAEKLLIDIRKILQKG